MYPDRDFDPGQSLPAHARELIQDLGLDTLVRTMAGEDAFLFDVTRAALLSGIDNDIGTVLYRQDVMDDCMNHPAVVRELYGLAAEAISRKERGAYFGFVGRYPGGILHGAMDLLRMLVDMLRRLRALADQHGALFRSSAFVVLFRSLQEELGDAYVASIERHLQTLRFADGVLLSARLGAYNEGTDYVLQENADSRPPWLRRLLGERAPGYTFRIHERDEAGTRALSELRDRGIAEVANATAQASEHLLHFFAMLRTELAFYVGALNARDRLTALGAPCSLPTPSAPGTRMLRFSALHDVALALEMGRAPVSNTLDADGANLVVITGANQGGKSSFLRSVGLAQVMMQCGMFVGADSFAGELCSGIFTHYTREEDAAMTRGKLDEEIGRLSEVVDAIRPDSTLLFNESFAATNEREGSEIATQVVSALLEKRVRTLFVTHLYTFAHRLFERGEAGVVFLRAERQPDGSRTFRVVRGEPLTTSYGRDLYTEIFRRAVSDGT